MKSDPATLKASALVRLDTGESVSAVARELGVDRKQIRRWRDSQLPPIIEKPTEPAPGPRGPGGGYTAEFKRAVLERARGQITLDVLAAEVGVARKTIIKWRHQAHETRKKRAFTTEFKLAAIARVERGEAPIQVANAIGVHRVQFHKWLRAHKEGRLREDMPIIDPKT